MKGETSEVPETKAVVIKKERLASIGTKRYLEAGEGIRTLDRFAAFN